MSELLSSIVGGGGKALIMPIYTCRAVGISLSANALQGALSTDAVFYTDLEIDHSLAGFETATLQNVSDNNEQTIIDTGTGKQGILTQSMSPRLGGAGTGIVTIRVTIDGKTTEFSSAHTLSDQVTVIGGIVPWLAQTSSSLEVGYNSGSHVGYYTNGSNQAFSILTPLDMVLMGLTIGMVFEDSLKVTVQVSGTPFLAGSSTHKAMAAWLNYIPEGL